MTSIFHRKAIKALDGLLAIDKRPQFEIDKASAEGVRIVKHIEQETQRMIGAYNLFVEARLEAIVSALGCLPEDLTLVRKELSPGGLLSEEILFLHDVPLMKFERRYISETEVQFIATPIEDEDN